MIKKTILYIHLMSMIGGNLCAQDFEDKSQIFAINYYHYFNYSGSIPNQKEWKFDLIIKEIAPLEFEACYSKELIYCLFNLNDLQKKEIKLEKNGTCFKYRIITNNKIEIFDKQEVIKQLKDLKKINFPTIGKKELKEIISNVDMLLDDDEILDKDLSREIALIHEFEMKNIPIGTSGTMDENGKNNFEELSNNEQDFLKQIDWKTISQIKIYKTQLLNDTEFMFDMLFGIDMISSSKRANFEKISKDFFTSEFSVDSYDNVTLNRDMRYLNKLDKRLTYLLKEKRAIGEKMELIDKLEIKKK